MYNGSISALESLNNYSSNGAFHVSGFAKDLIEVINAVCLGSLISIFGIIANSINIAVFCRQGLDSTINISFTMLAVSDLCSLVTYLVYGASSNPLVVNSGVPVVFSEVKHLTSGFPHACFCRVTAWITAYITAERCVCVAYPLKVKDIITPRRAGLVLVAIYAVMILSLVPEYSSVYVAWKFYPQLNRTLVGLAFGPNRYNVKGLILRLYAIYMLLSFAVIVFFTAILLLQFNRKSKWRAKATSERHQSDHVRSRDKKTVKMVILISGFFTASVVPSVIFLSVGLTVPGFDFVGEYSNLFYVCFSFSFVFDAMNSSAHIFLYYRMSSKYRETFHEIFGVKNCPALIDTLQ